MTARRFLQLLVDPVPRAKRERMAELWAGLDPGLRTPLQGLGRQTTGCGATLGVQPRCDFDCLGCYLGSEANAIPPAGRAEAFGQLATLRRHLGPKANVQLTDGEVTLLPEAELLELVREARRLGSIPMLMTHGDTFRRRPGLLERLVEAGLTEVSFHVDRLQKGRRGIAFPARSERDLEPLRAELAELVRTARRRTGVRLRAATTLTISRDNLGEVPEVVAWAFRHRDVFGLVSFQPLARVGRTRARLRGVGVDELWSRIAAGLEPWGAGLAARGPLRLGHPECTRVEPMLALEPRGGSARILRLIRPGDLEGEGLAARYLDSAAAGLNFRDDAPAHRVLRGAGALAADPAFWLGEVLPWARRRLEEAGSGLGRLALDLLLGRVRVDSFQVVSHHFMDAAELETDRGRERLAACVFRVPAGGRMVPMCAVNAGGIRSDFYESLRGAERAVTPPSAGTAVPGLGGRGRKAGTELR